MSVTTMILKTHSREDITRQFQVNDCITHHCKPRIVKMVVGRKKEIWFVANCLGDECGKISSTAELVVEAWNKWNPIPSLNKKEEV